MLSDNLIKQKNDLENKSSLSEDDIYQLARSYHQLAEFYSSLAESSSRILLKLESCYDERPKEKGLYEYFASLGAIDLSKYDDVEKFYDIINKKKKRIEALRDLNLILKMYSQQIENGNQDISLSSLKPISYMDTLESAIIIYLAGGDFPSIDINPELKRPPDIHFTPIQLKAGLAEALSDNDLKKIKQLLTRIEKDDALMWRVKSDNAESLFPDPILLRLISKAYYELSADTYDKIISQNDHTKKLQATLYLLNVQFCLQDFMKMKNLLKSVPDNISFAPFKGLISWLNGSHDEAWRHWRKCEEMDDPRNYFLILSTLEGLEDSLMTQTRRVVKQLGNPRQVNDILKTRDGRMKLYKLYAGISLGYYNINQLDSSLHYIREAETRNKSITPQNYTLTYSCQYYMIHSIYTKRPDFVQEGYQGWYDLKKEFNYKETSSVLEPLSTFLLCKMSEM